MEYIIEKTQKVKKLSNEEKQSIAKKIVQDCVFCVRRS